MGKVVPSLLEIGSFEPGGCASSSENFAILLLKWRILARSGWLYYLAALLFCTP